MRSLKEFLEFLPGIKPHKARSLILEGSLLDKDIKRDIFYRSFLSAVYVVGPDAASAIVSLYRSGVLPMIRGRIPEATPLADSYLGQADVLRAEIAELRRREACVKDISLVRESDFSDSRLLDRIFWANSPKGRGPINLAGFDVTKSLAGYQTNSGKNTQFEVTFIWIGSDGQSRTSSTGKPSAAFNRRNDAERDWGLPE